MESTVIQHIVRLVLGLIILVAGRNVFWLFVGAIGFLVGFELGSIWVTDQPVWLIVGVGIAIGLISAILAVVFQRVGFALAGFYAAVYLAFVFAGKLGLQSTFPALFLVAGVAGAILAALLTDWAIILLSALAGAASVSSIFVMPPAAKYASIVVLATIGVIVQRSMLTRSRRR